MNTDQKKVALGAGSGVVIMAALVFALYHVLPTPAGMDTALARLIFALQINAIATLPFFVMVAVVGNGRFTSEAIDPLQHKESKAVEINGRVADNTLQQNFVFFVATMALTTFLTAQNIQIIPALVTVYILARIAFWIGYRIHPLYRAAGMAATSYMNLGILLSVLYFLIYT